MRYELTDDEWTAGHSPVARRAAVVSVARIWLHPRKFVRPFKGIICGDISEFESYHPSHAVGLWASP
jgi:hypothetical protein